MYLTHELLLDLCHSVEELIVMPSIIVVITSKGESSADRVCFFSLQVPTNSKFPERPCSINCRAMNMKQFFSVCCLETDTTSQGIVLVSLQNIVQ